MVQYFAARDKTMTGKKREQGQKKQEEVSCWGEREECAREGQSS